MKQYLNLMHKIMHDGTHRPAARENMPGATALFGEQIKCNLQDGFPLLTTKKVHFHNILGELLWFMAGKTNVWYLEKLGVKIWTEDAFNYYRKIIPEKNRKFKNIKEFRDALLSIKQPDELITNLEYHVDGNLHMYHLGDCGYQYGKTWRNLLNFSKYNVDQLRELLTGLKHNPESRRHLLSSIDPYHTEDLALYWCHSLVQFDVEPMSIGERVQLCHKYNVDIPAENVAITEYMMSPDCKIPKYKLNSHMYQRSADVFLGVPYNIASYALMTELIAAWLGIEPGAYTHSFGNVHLYDNHKDAANTQLSRTPHRLCLVNTSKLMDELSNHGNTTSETGLLTAIERMLNYYVNDRQLEFTEFANSLLIGYVHDEPIKAKLSTGLK